MMIFVFGSNLSGCHGAGAAYFAERYRGAKRGVGIGLQGNSYAIPTKDERIQTLPLNLIQKHIEDFLNFAMMVPDPAIRFQVTCIGCGLAGFKNEQIAPLFVDAPDNCKFDKAWKPWLGDSNPSGSPRLYWGTYTNKGR